jgi:hypothetical protein
MLGIFPQWIWPIAIVLPRDVWCLRERRRFLYEFVSILHVMLILITVPISLPPPPPVPLLFNNTVVHHCVISAGASCGIARTASWRSVSSSVGAGTVERDKPERSLQIQVLLHAWRYFHLRREHTSSDVAEGSDRYGVDEWAERLFAKRKRSSWVSPRFCPAFKYVPILTIFMPPFFWYLSFFLVLTFCSPWKMNGAMNMTAVETAVCAMLLSCSVSSCH